MNEDMGRVCVLGTVVSKNPDIGSLIIDDGQASVLVLLSETSYLKHIKKGQQIRVFGKVRGSGNEIKIRAELVQNFDGIDRELYYKEIADEEVKVEIKNLRSEIEELKAEKEDKEEKLCPTCHSELDNVWPSSYGGQDSWKCKVCGDSDRNWYKGEKV